MRVTISSDVLPILTFTLHPVPFVNGVTQSPFGPVEPFSAYPAQARMLSSPSPAPTDVAAVPAGGAGRSVLPALELPVVPPELPQAAASRTTATAVADTLSKRVVCTCYLLFLITPDELPG